MKIDLDEILKGYEIELEKKAVGLLPGSVENTIKLNNNSHQGELNLSKAVENKRWLSNGPGEEQSYIHPGFAFGIPDSQLSEAYHDFKNPDKINIENTPFLKYINKNRYENMASNGPWGTVVAPFIHTGDMALQGGKYLGGKFISKIAPKQWERIKSVGNAGEAFVDFIEGTGEKINNKLGPSQDGVPAPTLSKRLRDLAHDYRYNPEKFQEGISKIKTDTGDYLGKLFTGDLPLRGYVAPTIATLGTAGLIHHMYKSQADKKAKAKAKAEAAIAAQQAAQRAVQENSKMQQLQSLRSAPQTHIYNVMPGSMTGGVPGMGSFSKYGSEKTADMIDALTSSVGRRVADRIVNQAVGQPQHHEEAKEKHLEITSKYPEMEKMLKKKKNKEYLEKLLKE